MQRYRCRSLSPAHIVTIDKALCSLGEFGHVRLVVQKGRLGFMVTWNSYDAVKWQRGLID